MTKQWWFVVGGLMAACGIGGWYLFAAGPSCVRVDRSVPLLRSMDDVWARLATDSSKHAPPLVAPGDYRVLRSEGTKDFLFYRIRVDDTVTGFVVG